MIAVVTGASGGIGRAIVDDLTARGDRVIGVDLLTPKDSSADSWVEFDLRGDMDVLANELQGIGEVDVLVNCAGIGFDKPAVDITRQDLLSVLEINLLAPAVLSSRLAKGMLSRGFGRIVNISSIHGRAGHPGQSAYDASKAALDNITRTMAAEWTAGGVLVNAVAPGFIRTPMCSDAHLAEDWFTEGFVAYGRLPALRAGEPREVSSAVNYLTSAENTYVSGQVLYVDGGLYSRF